MCQVLKKALFIGFLLMFFVLSTYKVKVKKSYPQTIYNQKGSFKTSPVFQIIELTRISKRFENLIIPF